MRNCVINTLSDVGLLVAGRWLLVVGCWLLVVGCRLSVVGCWLLVAGCWLLLLLCVGFKTVVTVVVTCWPHVVVVVVVCGV